MAPTKKVLLEGETLSGTKWSYRYFYRDGELFLGEGSLGSFALSSLHLKGAAKGPTQEFLSYYTTICEYSRILLQAGFTADRLHAFLFLGDRAAVAEAFKRGSFERATATFLVETTFATASAAERKRLTAVVEASLTAYPAANQKLLPSWDANLADFLGRVKKPAFSWDLLLDFFDFFSHGAPGDTFGSFRETHSGRQAPPTLPGGVTSLLVVKLKRFQDLYGRSKKISKFFDDLTAAECESILSWELDPRLPVKHLLPMLEALKAAGTEQRGDLPAALLETPEGEPPLTEEEEGSLSLLGKSNLLWKTLPGDPASSAPSLRRLTQAHFYYALCELGPRKTLALLSALNGYGGVDEGLFLALVARGGLEAHEHPDWVFILLKSKL